MPPVRRSVNQRAAVAGRRRRASAPRAARAARGDPRAGPAAPGGNSHRGDQGGVADENVVVVEEGLALHEENGGCQIGHQNCVTRGWPDEWNPAEAGVAEKQLRCDKVVVHVRKVPGLLHHAQPEEHAEHPKCRGVHRLHEPGVHPLSSHSPADARWGQPRVGVALTVPGRGVNRPGRRPCRPAHRLARISWTKLVLFLGDGAFRSNLARVSSSCRPEAGCATCLLQTDTARASQVCRRPTGAAIAPGLRRGVMHAILAGPASLAASAPVEAMPWSLLPPS
eukprot:scaffold1756_cov117-Isochrysis_galbana.AAC.3